jgi:hypothetical protein
MLLALSSILAASDPARTPVLVELFTSEGCSSCPPADRLLIELEKTQPIPGAAIIALSQHVDYWNRLGWTDPFSSPLYSTRQQQYSAVFRRDGVYTPQMVVDGAVEFVGSDSRAAFTAIASAARKPKTPVEIACRADPASLRFTVRVPGPPSADSDVLLAVTENELQSDVKRGENSGRIMQHRGVVRKLQTIGRVRREPFASEQTVPLEKYWSREHLTAVAFLQERSTRRVVGAVQIACMAN